MASYVDIDENQEAVGSLIFTLYLNTFFFLIVFQKIYGKYYTSFLKNMLENIYTSFLHYKSVDNQEGDGVLIYMDAWYLEYNVGGR
jgi:hypothetical protein